MIATATIVPISFRTAFLLAFLACAGLLAYALYTQFALRLQPCPFCIFQRVAMAAAGLLFLIGGLHAPRGATGRRIYGVLTLLACLVGAGISARHVWVQLFPPPGVGCSAGLDFMVQMQGWSGTIRKVLTATGDCSTIDWRFLGLSMPAWVLIWFLALGVWALWAGFRRAKPAALPTAA